MPLDVVEKVPADLDTRLDARFLDARRPRVSAVFQIRSTVTRAIYEFFFSRGFYQYHDTESCRCRNRRGDRALPDCLFRA